jgi:hypothetical protein
MQRFKKYIGKDFILGNVRDSEALRSSGFACDNLPDSIGDFDECEFLSDFNGQPLLLCIAVLTGKVKRIMFVVCNRENPDEVRPLSEAELKNLLDQRGEYLVNFFEHITR